MSMINRCCFGILLTVFYVQPAVFSNEPDWGDLQGRFVYQGDPPKNNTIRVTKNKKLLGPTVPDESLLIDPEDHGIANVVVYLKTKANTDIRVHPSYAKSAKSKVRITAREGRIIPHVLLLRTSQVLEQRNKDSVGYNLMYGYVRNPRHSTIPSLGRTVSYSNLKQEPYPIPVCCAIHPWMNSTILIRNNPYMAKTDSSGRFAIKNLPVGEHTFYFWHEKPGLLRNVRFDKQLTSNSKGRLTITVKKNGVILKDAILGPAIFEDQKSRSIKAQLDKPESKTDKSKIPPKPSASSTEDNPHKQSTKH